jgi:hypothetical protein
VADTIVTQGNPGNENERGGDALFPEDNAMRLAMRHEKPNLDKIRQHLGLTEAQAAELGTTHTQLFTGIIPSGSVAAVHGALTSALTRPPITQADLDDRAQRSEEHRKRVLEDGLNEHTWAFDQVFARAKENVSRRPELVKLLRENGMDNDPQFWRAAMQQARLQLKREGKL